MIRFFTSCCVVCVAMTSIAEAQFFGFGPWGGVHVRAPFVSVDVAPYVGPRIIAPAPVARYYSYRPAFGPFGPVVPVPPVVAVPPVFPVPVLPTPVYPTPVYPTPVYPELAQPAAPPVDYRAARPAITGPIDLQLRAAAERLARSLSTRRDDADVWLRYLDPQRIIEAIDRGQSPDSLRDLLSNYDGVVGNRSLVSISQAPGFGETRQLLRQYVGGGQPASRRPAAPVAPTPAPDERTDAPTPAPAVQPAAEEADEAEELPVPPPPQPRLPAEPTPV